MTVYLVRHGETAHNRDGLGLGRHDVELTAAGLRQAEQLGERFAGVAVERVLASPLVRARTMAEIIARRHGLAVEVREELIEFDVGETEGLPFPVIRERYGDLMREWAGPDGPVVRFPGGERLIDVAARVAPLLDELRTADANAVVVSHNFVVRLMVCQALGLEPAAFRQVATGLASVSTLAVERSQWVVQGLNDRCHLEA